MEARRSHDSHRDADEIDPVCDQITVRTEYSSGHNVEQEERIERIQPKARGH